MQTEPSAIAVDGHGMAVTPNRTRRRNGLTAEAGRADPS